MPVCHNNHQSNKHKCWRCRLHSSALSFCLHKTACPLPLQSTRDKCSGSEHNSPLRKKSQKKKKHQAHLGAKQTCTPGEWSSGRARRAGHGEQLAAAAAALESSAGWCLMQERTALMLLAAMHIIMCPGGAADCSAAGGKGPHCYSLPAVRDDEVEVCCWCTLGLLVHSAHTHGSALCLTLYSAVRAQGWRGRRLSPPCWDKWYSIL